MVQNEVTVGELRPVLICNPQLSERRTDWSQVRKVAVSASGIGRLLADVTIARCNHCHVTPRLVIAAAEQDSVHHNHYLLELNERE